MRVWGYLDRCGVMLDEFLCALLGGPENTPISLVAAQADRQEHRDGRTGWGCIVCRWLSLTVERYHCAKQLNGIATQRWAALRAGLQLAALFAVLFYGVPFVVERVW